jgi:tRNA A58 N-methylase Trm61
MFDQMSRKWKLGRLNTQRVKIGRQYDREIEKARNSKSGEEKVDSLVADMFMETDLIEEKSANSVRLL